MKRKSLEVSPNTVLPNQRNQRKHKTQGANLIKNQSLNLRDNRYGTQIICHQIIEGLLSKTYAHINVLAKQQLLDMIIENVNDREYDLSNGLSPSHEPDPHTNPENRKQIKFESEPERLCFDPICGFDKLITRKNNINIEAEMQQRININTDIAHVGKSKANFPSKTNSIIKVKQSVHENQKFIPLQPIKNQTRINKQEAMLRERIFESNRTLPLIRYDGFKKNEKSNFLSVNASMDNTYRSKPQKTSKILSGLNSYQNTIHEDSIYDYNGEKIQQTQGRTYYPLNMTSRGQKKNIVKTLCQTLEKGLINNLEGTIQSNQSSIFSKNSRFRLQANQNSLHKIKLNKQNIISKTYRTPKISNLKPVPFLQQIDKNDIGSIDIGKGSQDRQNEGKNHQTLLNFQRTKTILTNTQTDQFLQTIIESKFRDMKQNFKAVQSLQQASQKQQLKERVSQLEKIVSKRNSKVKIVTKSYNQNMRDPNSKGVRNHKTYVM